MYNDMYLKFADKAQADSVLYTSVETAGKKAVEYTQYLVEGAATEDGEVEHGWTEILQEGDVILDTKVCTTTVKDTDTTVIQLQPNFANIDVLGTIYRPTGEVETVDGMEVPVMAALDGYHINVRAVGNEDTSALLPYAVTPSLPCRVWG